MLEHVALGQSRFSTPGVAPDPRGVLLGRYALLVFPTLEGVVSWLRLYSAEAPLDELMSGLQIARVKTPLGSREMVLRLPAPSSYVVDRAARMAQLVGGVTYTGTTKHFVKYRDERSPYGYDATDIRALPPGTTWMVHGDGFIQTYSIERELSLEDLLFRLSRRRVRGGMDLGPDDRRELYLVVAVGLAEGVTRYLWRNRVTAELGVAVSEGESAFEQREARRRLVFKVHNLPERILSLFLGTPGIDVFRPLIDNAAVEVGYTHLIDLPSCRSLFRDDRFYLFWGREDRVDRLIGPLELSGIEHVTKVDIDLDKPTVESDSEIEAADPVGVHIELAPSLDAPRRVVGALIPTEQLPWLKRLVFLLPETSLRGHRAAVTDRGVLVVARPDVDVVPLGQQLSEAAPGLLLPLGMDLVPRVAPDVLARNLGHGSGVLTVFPADGKPFQVDESQMVPLERRALARVEVPGATVRDLGLGHTEAPHVVNDPVGRFALWGYRPEPSED